MPDFNQTRYWRARHKKLRGDPRSVGNLARSRDDNLVSEAFAQTWVGCAAGLLRPYASVLDVGCGYGRVAGAFCDQGFDYTGIDVSPVAVAAAAAREPRGRFLVGSALDHDFGATFDLIVVLYVFVHFVDDAEWARLIGRLSARLNDGGGLLFADEFPDEPSRPQPHVALRPLEDYLPILAAVGLALDADFADRLRSALDPRIAMPPAHLARTTGRSP